MKILFVANEMNRFGMIVFFIWLIMKFIKFSGIWFIKMLKDNYLFFIYFNGIFICCSNSEF